MSDNRIIFSVIWCANQESARYREIHERRVVIPSIYPHKGEEARP